MKTLKAKWFYILILAVSIILPFFMTNRYFFQVVTLSCLFSICALSLNLIMGYTGQPSLAHAGFFGIGAYAVAKLTLSGFSFWLALPLAGLISAAAGLIIGIPTLRTKGAYFSIATMCMGVIITLLAENMADFTGGANGIVGIPPPNAIPIPSLGEIGFQDQIGQYYLVLTFLLITLFVMNRLVYSLKGLSFMAVRNNEALADSVGINTFGTKLLSFIVSNFIVGIAGGLYSSLIGSISPSVTSIELIFQWLVFVLLGGAATLAGPIIGSFVLSILHEALQAFQEYYPIVYGILLILVVVYLPKGLMGAYRNFQDRMKSHSGKRRVCSASEDGKSVQEV